MVTYNIYCKDENMLTYVFTTLSSVSVLNNVRYVTSDFMPRCIEFSSEIYNDEGIMNLLRESNIKRKDIVILRHLHSREMIH